MKQFIGWSILIIIWLLSLMYYYYMYDLLGVVFAFMVAPIAVMWWLILVLMGNFINFLILLGAIVLAMYLIWD